MGWEVHLVSARKGPAAAHTGTLAAPSVTVNLLVSTIEGRSSPSSGGARRRSGRRIVRSVAAVMMRNVNAILTTNAASASSRRSSISAPHPHRAVHRAAVGVAGAVAHNFMQMTLDAFINDGANLLQ